MASGETNVSRQPVFYCFGRRKGQALVEFTLILPILLLIMLAAYFVGAAMYTGANASSALRAGLAEKALYADSENALIDFKDHVNSFKTGTFQIPGETVDKIWLEKTDRETAVIVARKTVDFPLFPTFNFIVTQGVRSSLIANNRDPSSNTYMYLPYNDAHTKKSANINPANYKFKANVPAFVPITYDCTPDLSVFDAVIMNAGCDGGCEAAMIQEYFDDHIEHVKLAGGCAPTAFKQPTGVFDPNRNKY